MSTQADFADLHPGENVTLVTGVGDESTNLPARVASSDDGVVALHLAMAVIQPEMLATGTPVRLLMPDGQQRPAEVVLFEPGPKPLVVLERPTAGSRHDSARAFHRVPMQLMEVLVTHVTGTGAARFRVRIMDLSGGGARILCPRPVAGGDLLSIRLPLLDGRVTLDVKARAVWTRNVYKSWQTGIEFVGLTDPQRDQIVRTVFLEEVRWRRVP